ncbi:MAG: LysM peptidoglycan-binding domain-containing protein [Bradymonadia bacterium]
MNRVAASLLCGLFAVISAAEARTYTIERGDTLGRIAARFDCTVERIQAHNGLSGTSIRAGATLKIPRGCTQPRSSSTSRRRSSKRSTRRKGKKADLESLMRAEGFRPPAKFKALVVQYTLNKSRTRVVKTETFQWKSTGDDTHWNPASTIKLFSGVAALDYLRSRGFGVNTSATFYDKKGGPKSYRVADLIADALGPSNNIAHNRLSQLAGYDWMNGRVLARKGAPTAAIHKPYEKSRWLPLTGADHFRTSPKIKLRQGSKKRTIPSRSSKKTYACKYSSACASLEDLAEVMRRLMLHEQIPSSQRYNLGIRELRAIRNALKSNRKRGMEIVKGIESRFKKGQVAFYHKPGFSENWMSDVIYVYRYNSRRRWVVAMAGYPGRDALNRAARAIGAILAQDGLD